MSTQVSRQCNVCKKPTLHEKQTMSTGMCILLTIVTAGLFIPFWLFYSFLILPFRPYRCQSCGKGRLT